MAHRQMPTVGDVASACPKLRGDLIFMPRDQADDRHYVVEDPLTSKFFRLGYAEYRLVSMFDGKTSIADALAGLSTVMPEHRLADAKVAGLCRWLVANNLLEASYASARAEDDPQTNDRWQMFNPLFVRIPCGCPDRWLSKIVPATGWLFALPAVVAWCLLLIAGGYAIGADWERFQLSAAGVVAPANWIWLGLCWLSLKCIHEVAHGVACKRFGGDVREWGVVLILFAPLAFVDVTSSWRLRSRWRRICVSFAGMYFELGIAAIAALVWSQTSNDWLGGCCFNAIAMAGFTTIAFNANPLMKFDGYYILSDALGMPNLYLNGQAYLRHWVRRVLLNVPSSLPPWQPLAGLIIRVYAWLALGWRCLVCIGLLLAAGTMFKGAGIILAALAALIWIGIPMSQFVSYLVQGADGEQPSRLRFLGITGTCAAILAAIFMLPWPGLSRAPAIIEFAPLTVVRTRSSGFLRQCYVHSGQQVEQGQRIAVLENRALRKQLAELEIEIKQSDLRGHGYENRGELAAHQAEGKRRAALMTQLAELRNQVNALDVRAPTSGIVLGRHHQNLIGAYLEEGSELLSIGDPHRKELRALIAQKDLKSFAGSVGATVNVRDSARKRWTGKLYELTPAAQLSSARHSALYATNGGPIPVRERFDDDGVVSYEPLSPHFMATVPLTESQASDYRSGERLTIEHRPMGKCIGLELFDRFSECLLIYSQSIQD